MDVRDIHIERAHRTGLAREDKPRTIVLKLLNFKDKEKILAQGRKLKGKNMLMRTSPVKQQWMTVKYLTFLKLII